MGTDRHIAVTAPSSGIPNHPHLPVIVRTKALVTPTPETARDVFRRNGWTGTWCWTVFDFHHYHPDSHEALVCVGGTATLILGGPGGPDVDLAAGDAVILSAGVGHCRHSASPDFAVVGAYPPGQADPDILRDGDLAMAAALTRVVATPLPVADPFAGESGPLVTAWQASGGR